LATSTPSNRRPAPRGTWFSALAASGGAADLPEGTREELARLDDELFAIWNLGENVLLAWTQGYGELLFLSVRHHAIPDSIHAAAGDQGPFRDPRFINEVLSGPKYRAEPEFDRFCKAFGQTPHAVDTGFVVEADGLAALVSDMVRCYGVTLVRNRAVVLLDAVGFSLRSPLDQMAMLNSLSYSVNSAYAQLLSKNIQIDFARTTTGDGFYIWNRATTPEASTQLYKLMIMLLADNAVAQRKARSSWVPKLRAAFHVGEHYEFHQVEGINPTNFSYIVGQVTVDLARMVESALSGQILLGDFITPVGGDREEPLETLDFVDNAAATIDQLHGLDISGGRVEKIRCYLTGRAMATGHYLVNRYLLRDKHNATRIVYNAKINIHRASAEPIYLGIQNEELWNFDGAQLPPLDRETVGAPGAVTRAT
jgi:hypothetical protein